MAKKPRPNWTPAMVQSPSKKTAKASTSKPRQTASGKTFIAKTEASPVAEVKRGRPKKDGSSPPYLYLEADFYLVSSPEGYSAAAEDWWGSIPSTLGKGPEEFPAIVAFFERTEAGAKVQSTCAPRRSLGFTKEEVRVSTTSERAPPQVIEKIVEKIVEVEVPVEKIVERVVEIPADPTFPDALRAIFEKIWSLTSFR